MNVWNLKIRPANNYTKCIQNTHETEHKLMEATQGGATSGVLFKMKRRDGVRQIKNTKNQETTKSEFPPDFYPVNSRWVVITSIFPPTNLIRTLVGMKGWCTVVVTDRKSPPENEYIQHLSVNPICLVYLTIEKQLELDYEIIKHTPFNSFGRKNIGYVFAVHHGARVVYDTDDDNEIADIDMLQYWASIKTQGFGHVSRWYSTGINPYRAHGGNREIWPRGLPMDQIKNRSTSEYHAEQTTEQRLCIIQSLADYEPDVDAIYRLTNPDYPLHFSPSDRVSVSTVKDGQAAPFNAQATLFFEDAFNTMLLPVTVHGRVSDIWRGYMAQAVIRDKCKLAFTTPWVVQVRHSHNYMADLSAEIPMYLQAPAFVEHTTQAAYQTMSEAMIDAYEHGILEKTDVQLAAAWERDLTRARTSASRLSMNESDTGQPPVMFRQLLILMGRGVHLKQWMNRVLETPALNHVDMVLGPFDHSAESLECPEQRATCTGVSGTTWTTGRNILAREAFMRERRLSRRYSFWTFGDADVTMQCSEGLDCAVVYDRFLHDMPTEVKIVAMIGGGTWPLSPNMVMVELPGFDAAWNSIRREAVPIMLPYRTDEDSNSWWSSQGIFWNRLQCLSPFYGVAPLTVFYGNPEHNPYPRNARNMPSEHLVADRIMGRLSSYFERAPYSYEDYFNQERVRTLPLTINWPPDETFRMCNYEFSSEFFSFVANNRDGVVNIGSKLLIT
jgi:hypothetical protein